ncbi:hypothetical protein N7523_003914 [Penicillium sp. IBT 18751x]|nr:hypothetical protein N7523_003914 [Penicillium sp. IBT 18751x]
MRRIPVARERLSSYGLYFRPLGPEHCLTNRPRLLRLGRTGLRQISSASQSSQLLVCQFDGSRPHPKHLRRHLLLHEFTTTGRLWNSSPESIETTRKADNVILPSWNSPEEEAEYATKFFQVLSDGQPDQMMTAMTDPRSAGLVGSLPQAMFIEAFNQLSPAHFVEPFRDLHHPLHTWSTLLNGLKRVEEIFDDFVRKLLTITHYRIAGENLLGLAEYTHLLDCARSMGNGPLADDIWKSMEEVGVSPDVQCYNHYMEALVWDHCYTGQEAFRLRILPRHYYKRRMESRGVGWQGYGTGGLSVRKRVMNLFSEMLESGHTADERSYINLMLASARVGHGPGFRQILTQVWNLKVDLLKGEDHSEVRMPPTRYEPWSALHPTENLLFAIAHVFGTNNDISGAVQTIQFIAEKYDIPITPRVWHELFERAYVLSRVRTTETTREQQANDIGRVSMQVVQSIFNTMTSEPYNVRPTVQTHRFMINIAIDKGNLEACKVHLAAAYNILSETRRKQRQARTVVMRCLNPVLDAAKKQRQKGLPVDQSLFQSPILADAIHAYDLLRLEVYQQTYLIRRAVWLIARVPQWKDTPDHKWFHQERPKIMEEWRDFLPDRKRIFYDESSGFMDMKGPTGFKDRYWHDESHVPIRRMTYHEILFKHTEPIAFSEATEWRGILKRFSGVDTTRAPLNRLFEFERPSSPKLKAMLKELRENWVDYPEDHQLSPKKNPNAGFYGKLAALGLLKSKERGIFLLDDNSWV